MRQIWYDLLFAHWPVPVEMLRQRVPPQVPIDTFENQAWIGITPFGLRGARPRGFPALPWLSSFPELNVRTYVTLEEKPGIYFFSLDAGNAIAVLLARRFYRLPYFHAQMSLTYDNDWVQYHSYRAHRGPAEFIGRYRPTGEVFQATRGSLEYFLTERYCLYTIGQEGQVLRGEIHHAPWPLQPASAEIERNTMAASHGITLPETMPLLHFARYQDVVVWPLQAVNQGRK